eukprot:g1942.t1
MSISLRFCPECNFLLKPRGKKMEGAPGSIKGEIVYWCSKGQFDHPNKVTWTRAELDEEEGIVEGQGGAKSAADESAKFVVHRNDLIKNSAAKLSVFNPNLVTDPTMMRTDETVCPNVVDGVPCGNNTAIMFMASAGAKGADGMKLVFICEKCRHKWLG